VNNRACNVFEQDLAHGLDKALQAHYEVLFVRCLVARQFEGHRGLELLEMVYISPETLPP
jgi:hypothetical protein